MQSKTSFFNKTVFWKSVTRFWPLWFLYAAVWFTCLPLVLVRQLNDGMTLLSLQRYVLTLASAPGLVSGFLTGCAAAMAVWSFLYSARSAHGMACLPLRREGLFVSVTLAGAVPILVIDLAIALLTLAVEAAFGLVQFSSLLTWLGANILCFVFFYGFAVFCAQLTGNLLVLPVLYTVLNFTAVVVIEIVNDLFRSFLFGAGAGSELLLFLSPLVQLLSSCTCSTVTQQRGDVYETVGYTYRGWDTLAAYAAVGLLFLIFALLLFRRRRMESAGDVVAVNVLKPIFKYCLTLGCALVLGWLLFGVLNDLPGAGMGGLRVLLVLLVCMLVGAFIGYFAAEMLIRKSFRVWRGRWTGFGVSALVIAALLLAAELDLFGFERWTPDAERVDCVVIHAGGENLTLNDRESIQAVISLHESIAANKGLYEEIYARQPARADRDDVYLSLTYYLGDRQVSRRYWLYFYIDRPDTYADVLTLQNLFNTPQAIASRKATSFELTADNILSASVTSVLPAADCARLAGYEDTESYILGYYGDLSEQLIQALSPEEKQTRLTELIQDYAADYSYEATYAGDMPATAEYADSVGGFAVTDGVDIDLSTVRFHYTWRLTPEEAMELYTDCIVPDMADQTIGKLWLICGESYRQSVYSSTIEIDAQRLDPNGDQYTYFYTVPTVASQRTDLWLSAHGVEMMTLAELGQ